MARHVVLVTVSQVSGLRFRSIVPMLWLMPSPTPALYRFDLDRARSVLTVSGEIDLAVTPAVDELGRQCSGWTSLTIDLSDVTFIDVVGLRHLLEIGRSLAADAPLVLRHPSPQIHRMLDLGLAEAFPNLIIVDRRVALEGPAA